MKSCLTTDVSDDGLRLEVVLTVEASPAKLAELAAAVAHLVDHAHGAGGRTADADSPVPADPAGAAPPRPQHHRGHAPAAQVPAAPQATAVAAGEPAILSRSPWFVFAADGDIPITVQCPACATRLPVGSADERDVAPVRREHVAEKPRCKHQLITNGFSW